MNRLTCILLLLLCTALCTHAKVHVPDSVMHRDGLYVNHLKIYNDSAVFQGVSLRLDLFNTFYYLGRSSGKLQNYELAVNLRLKQRFYPTIELGYSQGELDVAQATWNGKGGWTCIGLDFNGLRKNAQSLNALLVGIRIGTAVQQYDLYNVKVDDPYWKTQQQKDFCNQWRTECWGEVLAGCQVHIYGPIIMGWNLRYKVLFTRKVTIDQPIPYFVPGFGYRDLTQWGINYYLGWKF